MARNGEVYSFAFIFPMASGHVNPSLPVARALVAEGHQVHYLSQKPMREAIEATGASFSSDFEVQSELYVGRKPSLFGAIESLQEEYGMAGASLSKGRLMLQELAVELKIPGTLRWLKEKRADVVLCCPVVNLEAPLAAKVAGVHCVSLLTTAGPGSVPLFWSNILDSIGLSAEQMIRERSEFQGLTDCLERLEKVYGLELAVEDTLKPLGVLPSCLHSKMTLVTTAEFLADPYSSELQAAYGGHDFVYVGPLLDAQGAKRASNFKLAPGGAAAAAPGAEPEAKVMSVAKKAKEDGKKIVMVSLGTIITGDHADYGWNAHFKVNGEKRGISGKELCHSAWRGVFDVFGGDKDVLIVVATGVQPDALQGLDLPENCFCSPSLPQVDLLRLGVELFLTHGGQNSFMEALSYGVPLVVCPGFGDQPVNAAKVESLGIGLQVERPMGPLGEAEEAQKAYRWAAKEAMKRLEEETSFREKAMHYAASLAEEQKSYGSGVPLATKHLLRLAKTRPSQLGGA